MAQLGDAIARYHKLLEQPSYRETGWAEQFQEEMRQRHLVDSGRLLAPVLRPHFVTRRQFDSLVRLSSQLAEILDRLEAIAFASPALLRGYNVARRKNAGGHSSWLCARWSDGFDGRESEQRLALRTGRGRL